MEALRINLNHSVCRSQAYDDGLKSYDFCLNQKIMPGFACLISHEPVTGLTQTQFAIEALDLLQVVQEKKCEKNYLRGRGVLEKQIVLFGAVCNHISTISPPISAKNTCMGSLQPTLVTCYGFMIKFEIVKKVVPTYLLSPKEKTLRRRCCKGQPSS